jgi:hypothetical protein
LFQTCQSSQCQHLNHFGCTARCPQRILQRPPVAFHRNLHDVAILQVDTIAETQAISSEEVDVNISSPAMRFVFEMMMLDILQAMTHFGFAAAKSPAPLKIAVTPNRNCDRDGLEVRINDKFRANRTSAQF